MKVKHIVFALLTIILSSCVSSKKFVYLQDMEQGEIYTILNKYEAVVHSNDRLAITVSSKSPELAIPFNANGGIYYVQSNGTIETSSTTTSQPGYRVDVDGNIEFPILGKLHVEGMKVSEVTDMIRDKIIEGKYIKDPLVSLEFLNFHYSVLGASGAGVYAVEGDRVTLLEAIAKSGDIASRGKVNKVAVIREKDGGRVMYMHDLRTKDIFESPCYYLQQNDIVYIEPSYRKRDSEDTFWKYFTMATSMISALFGVIALIR